MVPVFPSRFSILVSLTRVQNRPLGTRITCLLNAVNRWPHIICLVQEPKHCGILGFTVKARLTWVVVVLVTLTVRLVRLENSRL